MKTRTLKVGGLLLTLAIISPVPLQAQTKLQSSVFGSGAIRVSSDTIRMWGTVGQAFVGHSGHASLQVGSGFWAQKAGLITGVEQVLIDTIPNDFSLKQNYPNPFNPTTTIEFALPSSSAVHLHLFDVLGRQVFKLIDEKMKAGRYK